MNKYSIALVICLSTAGVSRAEPGVSEAPARSEAVPTPARLYLVCTNSKLAEPRDGGELPWSGVTTLAVTLPDGRQQTAGVIQQNNGVCRRLDGQITDLEIYGECRDTLEGTSHLESVRINRVTGEFQRKVHNGRSSPDAQFITGTCAKAERRF